MPGPNDGTYSGLLGAFPYAFSMSESLLFRSYVVIGGLFSLLVGLAFVIAVVVLIGNTARAGGGTFTASRAFFVVVALFVVLPAVGPVLFVARGHRRGGEDVMRARRDALLAATGYLFICSVYVGLVISMPECFAFDGRTVCRDPPGGPLAPAVTVLYTIPPVAGIVPPILAAIAIIAIARLA